MATAAGAGVADPAVESAPRGPAAGPAATPARTPADQQFSAEQIAALSAPLNRANVRQRTQGRSNVSYIEGWHAIAEANRIFGFGAWHRETTSFRCVSQAERLIGREQKPGWSVTYIATVRITVGQVVRDGCGAGHGIDADLGQAHESALKEAETDAMKRALMTFGNPFGLALYDKEQRAVTGAASGTAAGPANRQPRPTQSTRQPTRRAYGAPQQPAADRDALMAQASGVIKGSGLTPAGVRTMLEQLGGPGVSALGQLDDVVLHRLVRQGISADTVAKWNQAAPPFPSPQAQPLPSLPLDPVDSEDDPPMAWGEPPAS